MISAHRCGSAGGAEAEAEPGADVGVRSVVPNEAADGVGVGRTEDATAGAEPARSHGLGGDAIATRYYPPRSRRTNLNDCR